MNSDPRSRISRPIRLKKLATIFAAVFSIAFGLCSTTVFTGARGPQKLMTFLIELSVVVEAICLFGLLAVGVLAVVRTFKGKSSQ